MGELIHFEQTPLLDRELHDLLDLGIVSRKRLNSLFVYGTLLGEAHRMVLGRPLTRPVPARLPGFDRETLTIFGEEFPNLVRLPGIYVVGRSESGVDGAIIPVSFDEIRCRLNPYESDYYTLRVITIPDWGRAVAYFGRNTWVDEKKPESLPHSIFPVEQASILPRRFRRR